VNFILSFSEVTLNDQSWIRPIVCNSGTRSADYSFVNIFAWREQYRQRVANADGCFVGQIELNGRLLHTFPIGAADDAQAKAIIDAMAAQNCPLYLSGVSPAQLETLHRIYPNLTAEPQTDLFDYLYDAEKMSTFAGKKLHAKRNYVNRFIAANPDYVFEPITHENLNDCRITDGLWIYGKDDSEFDAIRGELTALESCLANFCELHADGGLIRLSPGGTVIAFAIGERVGADTFVTHFEKALTSIDGSYQIINRDFTRCVLEKYPQIKYINREDDMGLENLRKAKRSYYPDLMEEKFLVTIAS
jgi:hypothetical protein